jgi:hypothetical protein
MKAILFFAFTASLFGLATTQAYPTWDRSKSESHGVQSKDQITPEELKEAQELADRFIRRFRETRDLTPMVDEMFTGNFKKMVAEDISWSGIVGQGRSLPEKLKGEQRLRCYIVNFNLQYLLGLYISSKVPIDQQISKSDDILPPKISQFFKENAPDGSLIETAEQAQKMMSFLEQAMTLMQDEVRKNLPEETEQFRKNLEAFEAHLDKHEEEKPSGQIYDVAKFGAPAGSRVIRVIIPFHVGLVMLKEGQGFKIDLALTRLPPD